MPEQKSDLEKLEDIIESMKLDPLPVTVKEGDNEAEGYLIHMKDPTDLHELMRRTRGVDIEFLPHALTNNVIVAYP